jgi:hypothetical protein
MAIVLMILKKDCTAVDNAMDFVRKRVEDISEIMTKQIGPTVIW